MFHLAISAGHAHKKRPGVLPFWQLALRQNTRPYFFEHANTHNLRLLSFGNLPIPPPAVAPPPQEAAHPPLCLTEKALLGLTAELAAPRQNCRWWDARLCVPTSRWVCYYRDDLIFKETIASFFVCSSMKKPTMHVLELQVAETMAR